MAWSQCASKTSGVSQSAGSAQASGAAEPMTAEPIINKSQLALNAFVTAIREKTDDITNLLSAMQEDKVVVGHVLISEDDDDYEAPPLTWDEFCRVHSLNGDRLKYALEALMDFETPVINSADGSQLTLRQFGRDNYVLVVGMLTGGEDKVVHLWFTCAMYLARHLDHQVPFCMRVVDADEDDEGKQ